MKDNFSTFSGTADAVVVLFVAVVVDVLVVVVFVVAVGVVVVVVDAQKKLSRGNLTSLLNCEAYFVILWLVYK